MGQKGIISMLMVLFLMPACTTTTTVLDVNKPKYLSEKYSYTDLKTVTEKMIASLISNPPLANRTDRPVIIIYGIQNRTDEHIDTKAITEKILTGLTQTHKVRFVNKEARDKIEAELRYQSQGMVSPQTRIEKGRQVGAEYMLTGSITSLSAEEGRGIRLKERKVKYYKVSLELTDLNTNIVEWSEEHEFAREVSKPFIGW